MKKLSLKNATSMLSRKEMKAIIGGYGGYGGSTSCYTSSKVCYSSGGINYTCFIDSSREGEEACCCGHDAGNDNCIMG